MVIVAWPVLAMPRQRHRGGTPATQVRGFLTRSQVNDGVWSQAVQLARAVHMQCERPREPPHTWPQQLTAPSLQGF